MVSLAARLAVTSLSRLRTLSSRTRWQAVIYHRAEADLAASLLIQLLALGSVGMVFLIDRLPAVYSSMHQYGIPFKGFAGYLRLLVQTVHYLFPGLVWEMVGALGLAGILMMLFIRSHRPFGAAVLFTLAISLSHFGLAGKFPYERACGYLIPLVVIGAGYLVEFALSHIQSARSRYMLYGSLSAATVGVAILSLKCSISSDDRMVEIPQLIAGQEKLAQTPSYAVVSAGSETLRSILPNAWIDPTDFLPDNGEVNLVYCLAAHGDPRLLMGEGMNERRILRRLDHPPKHQTPPASCCRLTWQRMRVQALRSETAAIMSFPCLIVWRPAPDHLGLDGSAVREHMARFDVPYLQHNTRVPAKLSFFSRLTALEFLPQSTAEMENTMAMVKEGMNRFGGSAWLFQPREESGD